MSPPTEGGWLSITEVARKGRRTGGYSQPICTAIAINLITISPHMHTVYWMGLRKSWWVSVGVPSVHAFVPPYNDKCAKVGWRVGGREDTTKLLSTNLCHQPAPPIYS